jgi:hypothetical protein
VVLQALAAGDTIIGIVVGGVAAVNLLVALLPSLCPLSSQTMACEQCDHWYHHHCKALVIASLSVVSLLLLQGDMIICVLSLLACQGFGCHELVSSIVADMILGAVIVGLLKLPCCYCHDYTVASAVVVSSLFS